LTYKDIHDKIQPVVQWRNRIAHLKQIYNKQPLRHYKDILELIGYVSPELSDFVDYKSEFRAILNRNPIPISDAPN